MRNNGLCRSCGAAIIWLKHKETGKANPIDALPASDGNLFINRDAGLYRQATGEEKEKAIKIKKPMYISHFATCPNSARHRKEQKQTSSNPHADEADHEHECCRCSGGKIYCFKPRQDCIVDEPVPCVDCLSFENEYYQKRKKEYLDARGAAETGHTIRTA